VDGVSERRRILCSGFGNPSLSDGSWVCKDEKVWQAVKVWQYVKVWQAVKVCKDVKVWQAVKVWQSV